jgi:hypothetical protein
MPDMRLDTADAAELAEMLQFLAGWLARDSARLAASLEEFVGHPPTTWPSCARIWSGSSFCSAAATASSSLAHDQAPPASAPRPGGAVTHAWWDAGQANPAGSGCAPPLALPGVAVPGRRGAG